MAISPLPRDVSSSIQSSSITHSSVSLIKELIDNAVDAQATSVTVNIASNALDRITVTDNGKGVSVEGRELLCTSNCTSKLQDLDELSHVGGRSLGFRGAALAAIAELCDEVVVSTKTKEETAGVCLKFSRDGRLISNSKVSHPIGTTVRLCGFLNCLPVRRQVALKATAKPIHQITHTLMAYAFAHTAVRFSLKVIEGKADNPWTYVPASPPTLSDAIWKLLGKGIMSQCEIATLSNVDGENRQELKLPLTDSVQIVAALAKPAADLSKINNIGQYISIDKRPMAANRGFCKEMTKAYISYLRDAQKYLSQDVNSALTVSQPFLAVDISCPLGSYDINVEPSKDDVLFTCKDTVLRLWEALLRDLYHGKYIMTPKIDDKIAPVIDSPQVGPAIQRLGHGLGMHQPSSDKHQCLNEDILPEHQSLSPPDSVKIPPYQAVTGNPWTIAKARSTAINKGNDYASIQVPHFQGFPRSHQQAQDIRSVTPNGRVTSSPIRREYQPVLTPQRRPREAPRDSHSPVLNNCGLSPVSQNKRPANTIQRGLDTWLQSESGPSLESAVECSGDQLTRRSHPHYPASPELPNLLPCPRFHNRVEQNTALNIDNETDWKEKAIMHDMRFGQALPPSQVAKRELPLHSQLPSPAPSPQKGSPIQRNYMDLREKTVSIQPPELAFALQSRRDARSGPQSRLSRSTLPLESTTPESAVYPLNTILKDVELQKLSTQAGTEVHCTDPYDWAGQAFEDTLDVDQISAITQRWKERLVSLMIEKFDRFDVEDISFEDLIEVEGMAALLQKRRCPSFSV